MIRSTRGRGEALFGRISSTDKGSPLIAWKYMATY